MRFRDILKTALAWVGCVYGILASLYFAAWHLCAFQERMFCRFDFDSFSSTDAFLYLFGLHGIVVFLVFLESSETEFRWVPLARPNEWAIAIARNLLVIAVGYLAVLLLGQRVAPTEWPGRNPALILTAGFFVQTLFVALFFLFGSENLFSPGFRRIFDVPRNLIWVSRILRKRLGRPRRGPHSDA